MVVAGLTDLWLVLRSECRQHEQIIALLGLYRNRHPHIETAQYEKLVNLLNVFSEQVAAGQRRNDLQITIAGDRNASDVRS